MRKTTCVGVGSENDKARCREAWGIAWSFPSCSNPFDTDAPVCRYPAPKTLRCQAPLLTPLPPFAVMADGGGFKARDIGLRAQKKILSRMASKNVARVFIDDTTSSLLDNLYRLAKSYVSSAGRKCGNDKID